MGPTHNNRNGPGGPIKGRSVKITTLEARCVHLKVSVANKISEFFYWFQRGEKNNESWLRKKTKVECKQWHQ